MNGISREIETQVTNKYRYSILVKWKIVRMFERVGDDEKNLIQSGRLMTQKQTEKVDSFQTKQEPWKPRGCKANLGH